MTAGSPLAGPPVLDFSGSRSDGWPVSTPEGVVAAMDVSWWTSEFTVADPGGAVLCRGRIPFGAWGRRWEVVDGAGAAVLELGVGWGRSSEVRFAGGRVGAVRGEFLSRSWEMTDAGSTVLRSVPTSSAWGFRPDAWLVQQDGSLTLVQFVAAVQTYRRMVQRRRGAASAAANT